MRQAYSSRYPPVVSTTTPSRRFDAVFCDVDGCLSPEFFGPADTAKLAAVSNHNRRAHEIGDVPAVTLCTGRPLPFADCMARIVGVRDLPIVCEGGVWVLDPTTYRWEMDPSLTHEHLSFASAFGRWALDTFPGTYLETGKSASVTIFHEDGPDDLRERVLPAVEREIAERGAPFHAAMTWTCINIEPAFVSKATGLDRAIARARLDPARLAGIGDTMSDHPIRERVAYFACPANASDAIKAHADYVSPLERADAVLDILSRLS